MPAPTIRVYGFPLSGHAHRVELMLSLLGLEFERIEVDLLNGAQKQPAFLAKNPFGQIPVLEDGEVTLADSNAILVYLASRYDRYRQWLPQDPLGAAQVQRWLSIAAGELAHGPAAARLVALFGLPLDGARARTIAEALYTVLDAELKARPFLVGEAPTIADVALYSYTAHAPEGGVLLEPYPSVRAWLQRIEALPGFVPMPRSAAKAA
jgi:glutathione S-transferase